ncbi:MAG: sigma-70 family RNA polymerase sigma factor [Planctomycetes bacterium]|nr:sigma-70 family RNA polymerase sigma factor [Planctomycetota bacterium]
MADPILHRVAAGEPGAVQECLDRYGGLVWSLARRFCPQREEAEDAVQEVFIEIWNKAKRYDATLSSEITFIAMIARRRLIDRGRRRQRALQADGLEDENILPAAEDRAQELVDVGDEVERAQKALAKLRPDEQKVLRLSIYEGMSHDQIAKATALPLGTVKTHLRRGLIRVRELLGAGPIDSGAREEPQEEGVQP